MGTDAKKKTPRTGEPDVENLVLKIKSIPVRRRGRPSGNHVPFNPAEKRVRNAHLESIRRHHVRDAYDNLRCAMGIQRMMPRHTTVRFAVEMVRSLARKEIKLKMLQKLQDVLKKRVVQLLMEQESGWKIKMESEPERVHSDIDNGPLKAEAAFSSRIFRIKNKSRSCPGSSRSTKSSRTNNTHSANARYRTEVSRTLQDQNLHTTNSNMDSIQSYDICRDNICPDDIDSCTNGVLTLLQHCTSEVIVKSEPSDEPAPIEVEVEPFEPGDWELFTCGLSAKDSVPTEPAEPTQAKGTTCKHTDDTTADWVPSYAQKTKDWVPSYKHYFAQKLAKLKRASQSTHRDFERSPLNRALDRSPQKEAIDHSPPGQVTQFFEIDSDEEEASEEEIADWCVSPRGSPNVSHALRDHNYQRACYEPPVTLPALVYALSQSERSPS